MRIKKQLTILIILVCHICDIQAADIDIKPLYQELRHAIDSITIYDARQQKHIDELKMQLKETKGNQKKEMELTNQIFQAYSKFCYDSAKVYLDRTKDIVCKMNDDSLRIAMDMQMAFYYSSAGSFVEALNIVSQIDEAQVPTGLLPSYYDTMRAVYVEVGNSLQKQDLRQSYLKKSGDYRMKLMQVCDSSSLNIIKLLENRARYEQDFEKALQLSDMQMKRIMVDTPLFSELAFFRSCTYRDMGDREMQKYWLFRSALSDIRNSTKDQASLWTLAALLSQDGDVEMSYLLIRTSHDCLSYYNAPLRYLQSVNILSMIDHNYQIMTSEQNSKLRWQLGAISLLALLLLVSITFIYRAMNRLNAARKQLHDANSSLRDLNKQLASTIESLNTSNAQLHDANTIKEEYVGRFMSLCADYMQKAEAFRSVVLKKAKSGQIEEYLSTKRMREMKSKEVEELMGEFDKAFLNIVPNFVEQFNALLLPESRIETPSPESLTTELRIFALIRLGVTDSSKIAEFLHYSVQTIYNYRSSLKKNALKSREEFENEVKMIGT